MLLPKAVKPTAVFPPPLVLSVSASKPIAVLFAPELAASKAFSPRTVQAVIEFVPLPTVTEFIVASLLDTVKPLPSIFAI